MNSAIIVAAGMGTRFGGDVPKQFVDLAGKPVLARTLEKFQRCESVDEIVLVLPADVVSSLTRYLDAGAFPKLSAVVAGGPTRAKSVFNGLAAVDSRCEIVAIHDAARPFVTERDIGLILASARKSGAACLVRQVHDTIKRIDGGNIVATLDRSNLRRAQTPQAFDIKMLRQAFDSALLDESVTDECSLVERLGIHISIIEGSSRNSKITTMEDLRLAEAMLRIETENND